MRRFHTHPATRASSDHRAEEVVGALLERVGAAGRESVVEGRRRARRVRPDEPETSLPSTIARQYTIPECPSIVAFGACGG